MFKSILTVPALVIFVFLSTGTAYTAQQKVLESIFFENPTAAVDKITFKLNGPHIPKIFAIKGERPRVVFDFVDTKPARLLKNTINTNGKFVQRIRMGIHYEPVPKTRIVFDLLLDKKIDFRQNFDKINNLLTISVFEAGKEPAKPVILNAAAKTSPEPDSAAKAKSIQKKTPPKKQKPAAKKTPHQKKNKKTARPQKGEPVLPKKASAPAKAEVQPVTPLTVPAPAPKPVKIVKEKKKKESTKKAGKLPDNKKGSEKKQNTTPKPQQKAVTAAIPASPMLKSVSFDKKSNRGEMVLFRLNTFQAPIVFGVEEGQPRVVCDFKGTEAGKNLPENITVNGKYIHNIHISNESSPQKIRVILNLASNMSFDLQQVFFKKENLFVLIINPQGKITPREQLKIPGK
ncbi:MAG: hypothetical protein DSY50_07785 [Desulfobulbus sp.]|nr:MAG: hypothetical protein DSY50_07785 [Desulfobulbus sp.]